MIMILAATVSTRMSRLHFVLGVLLLAVVAVAPPPPGVAAAAAAAAAAWRAAVSREMKGDDKSRQQPSAVLESALVKPRPRAPYRGGAPTLQLHIARNEVESFLVVVSGGSSAGLTGVTVKLDADGPIGAATLFAARYVNASKPSGCSGAVGLWADPLVPDTDVYVGERRNAFPLTVPSGQSRFAWIDIFVPANASAGTTAHAITVTGSGDFSARLQLQLTVFDFALPTKPSMASIFGHGADWSRLQAAHKTHSDAGTAQLVKRYLRCGLMHGLSFGDFLAYGSNGTMASAGAVPGGGFNDFVAQWGSFFEGAALPFGPSPRALSAVQLPAHLCSLGFNEHTGTFINCTERARQSQIDYWRNLARNFDTKGWLPRLFDFTVDEASCHPQDGRWAVLHNRAPMVKLADPRLRVLVTTTAEAARSNSAAHLVDVYVPVINFLAPKQRRNDKDNQSCLISCRGESLSGDQRQSYDFLRAGNLFTYQACMSYGCGVNSTCSRLNGSACELGWPSLAIDHVDPSGVSSGLVNRAMESASYVERVDGELYYEVSLNFEDGFLKRDDALWSTANFYGGNGDGYLLYPGTPDRIGGTQGIPVESIRLKHIRDGFDDHQYLQLLERVSSRADALRHLKAFMVSPSSWVDNVERFQATRTDIGRAIEAAMRRAPSKTDDNSTIGGRRGRSSAIDEIGAERLRVMRTDGRNHSFLSMLPALLTIKSDDDEPYYSNANHERWPQDPNVRKPQPSDPLLAQFNGVNHALHKKIIVTSNKLDDGSECRTVAQLQALLDRSGGTMIYLNNCHFTIDVQSPKAVLLRSNRSLIMNDATTITTSVTMPPTAKVAPTNISGYGGVVVITGTNIALVGGEIIQHSLNLDCKYGPNAYPQHPGGSCNFGVDVYGGDDVKVRDVTIRGTFSNAIRVFNDQGIDGKPTAETYGSHALAAFNSRPVVLINNTLLALANPPASNVQVRGIWLIVSAGVIVSHNTVVGPWLYGIDMDSEASFCTIVGNTVIDARYSSIFVEMQCTHNVITGNRVRQTTPSVHSACLGTHLDSYLHTSLQMISARTVFVSLAMRSGPPDTAVLVDTPQPYQTGSLITSPPS
eukprot:SAG31_NODE_1108_length_9862_cov_5.407662_4_plen_1095_part_00